MNTAAEWEPNWCAACGNIAVNRPGTVCDICVNDDEAGGGHD